VAARIQSIPSPINKSLRSDYLRALCEWNVRLIEAQRSIRILEAVRWPNHVQSEFFARGCRELPKITRADYRDSDSTAQRSRKHAELRDVERDICSRLGEEDAGARILLRRCRSFQDAIKLIEARGTAAFPKISQRIYGSGISSKGMNESLTCLVKFLELTGSRSTHCHRFSACETAEELAKRLRAYFVDAPVSVKITSRLASEACAGTTYLKIKQDAVFSEEDIRLLEVHEGWVHLGTSVNGRRQPVLTILGKAWPAATATQEGLAVFCEFVLGVCNPERRRRLSLRLQAVMMAEQGADFLQVFRFLTDKGNTEFEAYRLAARAFRGSLPQGCGPFTKDLSYGIGLLKLLDYVRSMSPTDVTSIPLLFSGKTHIDELADMQAFHGQGLMTAGEILPQPFRCKDGMERALQELIVIT
jgi:uncharacterized protein (TIGR02421 family)